MHYAKSWEIACKAKITEEQNERTYVSSESVKGSGMKTKLKGDDRMYGKNMKKPIKVASDKDGGETVSTDVFKEVPDADTNTHFEDPRDYGAVPTLEADHLFEEPYPDARYSIVVPIDHSDDKLVNTVTKHPHQRFVGRKVRKSFEVDDVKKKRVLRSFEGKVKSYNEKRQLFRVQYDLDGEYEEMDFHELMQVLLMGKQFGDPKFHWGKTRAEVIEEIKVGALAKQKKEVVHYAMTERTDEAYERWYGREKAYRAEEQVVGDGTMEVPVPAMSLLKSEVVYDDEPKNPKELDWHPVKQAI